MSDRNPLCCNCGGETYAYNTRFKAGSMIVTAEYYKCRVCNETTPVYYNR